MGFLYAATVDAATAQQTYTVGKDKLTITCGSLHTNHVREFQESGAGTASAQNEEVIARSTVGTTPVALTPRPLNSNNTVAWGAGGTAGTMASTWTTNPTLANTLMRYGVNSNGALFRWVAAPGMQIEIATSTQLSFNHKSGSTNGFNFYAVVEEF